ncbi:tyrosyl-DNA phosphodiesterase [Fragilaria crotonensis]|nr:tyrosyl-DNA phosphodiesterase [Fragilaria crotonensis]
MSKSNETQPTGSLKDPVIIDDGDCELALESDRKLPPVTEVPQQQSANATWSSSSPTSQIHRIRAESKRRWEQCTQRSQTASLDDKSDAFLPKKPKTEADRHDNHDETLDATTSATPIKIFTSELPEPSQPISPHVRIHCRSLRELIGLEGSERNQSPIQWMVMFNYLVDFEHLIDTIPELISIPNMAVFYGHGEPHLWKQMNPGIHFQQLIPSDPQIPQPTHEFQSPLGKGDVSLKTQGAYVQDFPLKTTSGESGCDFEKDLITYLRTYNYIEKRNWSGGCGSESARSLCDEILRYDFTSAKVVLIPSTPGRSRLDEPKGYLKLADAIRKYIPKRSTSTPIICQFSSIGSLTAKWLQELVTSWDASQSDCKSAEDLQRRLKLVYPTAEEIRESVEGYNGGGSVPGRRNNTSKPFLQPLYHKWSSSLDSSNPLHKPNNVPHIKTFYQISQDGFGMEWFCLTSHNLSKAAWGEIINTNEGRRIFTRHWELGVFVAPRLFSKEKLVPAGSGGNIDNTMMEVPLPFQLNPTRYRLTDHPWAVDATYSKRDRFGRNGCI